MLRTLYVLAVAALLFGGSSWGRAQQFGKPVVLPDNALLPPIALTVFPGNGLNTPIVPVALQKEPKTDKERIDFLEKQFKTRPLGLGIQLKMHDDAHKDRNHTPSPQINHHNVIDYQIHLPRVAGDYYSRSGVSFVFPLSQITADRTALIDMAAATATSSTDPILSFKGDQRIDLVVDSAKLNPVPKGSNLTPVSATAFLPSLIPTAGTQWYGIGARTNIVQGDTSGRLGTGLSADVPTLNTTANAVFDVAYYITADGNTNLKVLHAYGQLGPVIFGKTDTAFSDPDAYPDSLNDGGPSGGVFVQHSFVGLKVPTYQDDHQNVVFTIALEAPETSVMPEDASKNGTNTWNSRSRFPDLAGNVRWADKSRGHLQFSAILRDVGIEDSYVPGGLQTNSGFTYASPSFARKDVFGWGTQLTGVFFPFRSLEYLANDYLSFGGLYGSGVGNYVTDLRALGAYDALFDAKTHLKALPVASYWVAYTHTWTNHLRSTVTYSQVDADTFTPVDISNKTNLATASPYFRGRYASVNLVYRWNVDYAAKDAAQKTSTPAPVGDWYTGIEFIYGDRENVDRTSGSAQRIQVTLGARF